MEYKIENQDNFQARNEWLPEKNSKRKYVCF